MSILNPKLGRRKSAEDNQGDLLPARLTPVAMVHCKQSEGATVYHQINVKSAPVSGHLATPMYVRLQAVWVPALAAYDLQNKVDDEYADIAEIFRRRLEDGQAMFDLVPENELSQLTRVVPKKIDGTKYVSRQVHLSYNAAVNHLRTMAHRDATPMDRSNRGLIMALLSSTTLDMFAGVNDPDERVNGDVNIAMGKLPVKGISKTNQMWTDSDRTGFESGGDDVTYESWQYVAVDGGAQRYFTVEEDADNPGYPNLHVNADNAVMSLNDLYTAKRTDALVKQINQILEQYPHDGALRVSRMVHNLSFDTGNQCVVAYDRTLPMSKSFQHPMDTVGVEAGKVFTYNNLSAQLAVPVPSSEFGGVLVVMASVLPHETLELQPHNTLTEEYTVMDFESEALRQDPERVLMRDLHADIDTADEETPAMWVGPNHMYRNYQSSGYALNADETAVAVRSSRWAYQVPLNAAADTIDFDSAIIDSSLYPFADWEGAVASFACQTIVSYSTKIPFGPTPEERLDELSLVDLDAEEAS